jgi:hypothetical protein
MLSRRTGAWVTAALISAARPVEDDSSPSITAVSAVVSPNGRDVIRRSLEVRNRTVWRPADSRR